MKIIQKTTVLLALLLICSCEDQLNVVPEDSVESATVFNTRGSINGAVIGIYSKNQSGDLNGNAQLISDFMSDNVSFVGSFPSLQEIDQFQTLATNATIDNIWLDAYEVIGGANNIIVNLPPIDLPDLSEEEKAQFIGEAKFLRAVTYFTLVNLFAQPFQFEQGANLGVPLATQPFLAESLLSDFQLERSTVNEVHALIEQDLLDAIAALPVENGLRAESGSARALLARLYLYQEKWEQAADFANQVINSGSYALGDNTYDFYDDNPESSENIFVVVNTPTDGPQDNDVPSGSDEVYVNFYNAAPGGRGDAPFSQDLLEAFAAEAGDRRFSELSVAASDAQGNDTFFTTKYPDVVNNASDGMVLRITEMYLIRAEANLQAGTAVGDAPLNDINLLRTRAGLADLATIDLDAILLERRKELCFEGHRRMDLLRNNLNLRPDGAAASAPGANKVIFPIVDDETTNNPNIIQNPGNF